MSEVWFGQKNPTLDKVAVRLAFAGAESRAPILAGLGARLTVSLRSRETFRRLRVYSDGGFAQTISCSESGLTRVADIVFGEDTDSGAAAVRNFLEWTTNRGTTRRQFWVKDLPAENSLFVNNHEAQRRVPPLYVSREATDEMLRNCTFSINILPWFTDEFFLQQWYSENRWANTVRPWGGAATAEVFLDDAVAIAEQDVADVHGYFWEEPGYGHHDLKVRLRALAASASYVDIDGQVWVRRIPCP